MNELKCPKCGEAIKIDEVLKNQIEANIKKEAIEEASKDLKNRLEIEKEKQLKQLELEKEKIKAEFEIVFNKQNQDQELLIKKLEQDSIDAKEKSKKLLEEQNKMKEEIRKQADEENRLKFLEMEKQLNDTRKALQEAERKSTQGSQQLQGEVLELELESLIRSEFVMDQIEEVKKGVRGADITQIIKNHRLEDCGIILYESKNASWQPSWIVKFKEDIRKANANIGILVSKEMPLDYGDMKCVDGVWIVKPKLIIPIATAIRNQILAVHAANHNSENKDEKMEVLYRFLTGTEFKHRIESIVENYTMLQLEIEKEKRSAQLRWSKQEKSIRAVIDNTLGMYGDLQGITGGSLGELKEIGNSDEEVSV